jgi:hypothetical protein
LLGRRFWRFLHSAAPNTNPSDSTVIFISN